MFLHLVSKFVERTRFVSEGLDYALSILQIRRFARDRFAHLR